MIAMMSVSVRLSRDSSVTINVSPNRIFPSNGPSFLSFSFLRPLTTSVTQRSTTMPLAAANRLISSCWFARFCFPVLTLK